MPMKSTLESDQMQPDPPASSKPTIYVLVFGGVGIGFVAWALSPKESLWVTILFSLPLIAQLIGGYFHINKHEDDDQFFYYFSMGLSNFCLLSYCFLWVCYRKDVGSYTLLSALALIVIIFIIICVGYMMCAFMKEPNQKKRPNLWKLRQGAEHEPLWAMSFLFFVLFLDVTYLFGFAFAFHDRQSLKDTAHKAPALRMANYDSPDAADLVATVAATDDGARRARAAKADLPKDEDTYFYFFFDTGAAQLGMDKELNYDQCELPTPTPTPQTGQAGPALALVKPPQRVKWLTAWYMGDQEAQKQFNLQFNRCSLERLKLRVEQETRNGSQARVVLIGQGDNQQIAERGKRPNDTLLHYKSNYELSEARVHTIRYKITEVLKNEGDSASWHNLEWLTLPASDEELPDDVLTKIFDGQKKLESRKIELSNMNKRVVTASIVPVSGDIASLQMQQHKRMQFRELDLMDYMYFSIYTITTTGYGDIVPTTAYSKFVVSVANICEVLFLVVFFNALVSIRGTNRVKPEKNGTTKRDRVAEESDTDILGINS